MENQEKTVIEEFNEVIGMINIITHDVQKASRGNNAAIVRVRKHMQKIKAGCNNVRKAAINVRKNEKKATS